MIWRLALLPLPAWLAWRGHWGLAFVCLVLMLVFHALRPRLHLFLSRNSKLVRRNKAKTSAGGEHFLDLDPEFLKAHPEIMPLAAYLGSLVYNRDDNELGMRLVSAVSSGLGLGANLVPFLLPQQYLPTDQSVLAKTKGIAHYALEQFPSILVMAALVDGAAAFFTGNELGGGGNGKADAADVFALGEAVGSVPELPQPMFQLLKLTSQHTLKRWMEGNVDLGNEPDLYHYVCPEPFSPLLLPGLCRGPGGLKMNSTPRQVLHSRAMAIILNKLAANFMALAGYGELDGGGLPYPKFEIELEDSGPISSCGDFLRELHSKGGGTLECHIQSNLTSFGYELCVLEDDEDTSLEFGPDVTTDQRHRYSPIPLAFRTRTGIVSPFDDAIPVHQLSTHSAVVWTLRNNKLLDDECVMVTFYTGVEGFTGYKPGWEWERAWVQTSQQCAPVQDAIRAADFAAVVGVCSNLCVREAKFPFGGYGGLGVCADSVAWIEHCLNGSTNIFPLVMRGDAKTLLLRVVHEHVLGKLKHLPECSAFVEMARLAAKSLVLLPNDIQVEPHEMQESLHRVSQSIFRDSPFMGDRFERARMHKVEAGWEEVLGNLGLWEFSSGAVIRGNGS
ncbi:hypothetical protein BASA81_008557 [Batrachochytrium salamandrivorans]|nr:hypothetical protein BASA81_008557 [Batrachochytrium salamandrivorans]